MSEQGINNMSDFENILLSSDRIAATEFIASIRATHSIESISENYVVPALTSIGKAWENGDASLSQVYMSGRICEALMDDLLADIDVQAKQSLDLRIVVLDDFHLLGKRIVYSLVRASGYEVHDYGRADIDTLIHYIHEDEPDVLMISTLMLRSALLIEQLSNNIARNNLKTRLMVGGAPFRFDEQLWQQVGAHAMGRTASDAVAVIQQFEQEANS
jgi:methanogenic corrinoid protein MtbC1